MASETEYDAIVPQTIGCNIGRVIAQRRKERGLSIRALARALDCDFSYLAKIERGEVNVRLSYLRRIAEALGCTMRVRMTAKEQSFGMEVWL